jgi:hypothetical protein
MLKFSLYIVVVVLLHTIYSGMESGKLINLVDNPLFYFD